MPHTLTDPVHVIRHCPRCGTPALTPHATYGFTCSICGFLFFLNVAAAVAAIIRDPDGRVLLTRRARDPERGRLDIPGGFVDWGETAEQAIAREIREELNVEVGACAYFCSVTNLYQYRGLTYRTLDFYFTCTVRDLAPLRAADDIDGYEFVELDALDKVDIGFEAVRQALRRLRESSRPSA